MIYWYALIFVRLTQDITNFGRLNGNQWKLFIAGWFMALIYISSIRLAFKLHRIQTWISFKIFIYLLHHIDAGKNSGSQIESPFSQSERKLLFKHRCLWHKNSFSFWAGDATLFIYLTQKTAQTIGILIEWSVWLAAKSLNTVCAFYGFIYSLIIFGVSSSWCLCVCVQCNCFDSSTLWLAS